MKYILFSDIHCDRYSCEQIARKSENADFAIGAGDYALFRKGLGQTIDSLSAIKIPVILVPGNHETLAELQDACKGLNNFHLLHGSSAEINGVVFMGIGYAIPVTPFIPWSVDLSEENAEKLLKHTWNGMADRHSGTSVKPVFITHSPPFGCLDTMCNNQHTGSRAILDFIGKFKPMFTVCGHIHERWNRKDSINGIPLINAGPNGYEFEYNPMPSGRI